MLFGSSGGVGARLRDGRLRSFAALLWLCLSLGMALMGLLAAGCGGGGGGDDTGGSPEDRIAVVTGRVLEFNENRAVGGVTIQYAGQTTQTDANGNFRFQVEGAAIPAGNLVVLRPTTGYQSGARVGNTAFNLGSGFSVPEVPLGTVRNVGNIFIYSDAYPPPPPVF